MNKSPFFENNHSNTAAHPTLPPHQLAETHRAYYAYLKQCPPRQLSLNSHSRNTHTDASLMHSDRHRTSTNGSHPPYWLQSQMPSYTPSQSQSNEPHTSCEDTHADSSNDTTPGKQASRRSSSARNRHRTPPTAEWCAVENTRYQQILSEMRPRDLMQFEQEWTLDFPLQNSVEATHWFTKATAAWKAVDEERCRRRTRQEQQQQLQLAQQQQQQQQQQPNGNTFHAHKRAETYVAAAQPQPQPPPQVHLPPQAPAQAPMPQRAQPPLSVHSVSPHVTSMYGGHNMHFNLAAMASAHAPPPLHMNVPAPEPVNHSICSHPVSINNHHGDHDTAVILQNGTNAYNEILLTPVHEPITVESDDEHETEMVPPKEESKGAHADSIPPEQMETENVISMLKTIQNSQKTVNSKTAKQPKLEDDKKQKKQLQHKNTSVPFSSSLHESTDAETESFSDREHSSDDRTPSAKKSKKHKHKHKHKKSKTKSKKSSKKSKSKKKHKHKHKRKHKHKKKKHSEAESELRKPKVMWVYKKILEPQIDDIYSEALPCPVRHNDFKKLPMDCSLPGWDRHRPPAPTWVHHVMYVDDDDEEEYSGNTNTNTNTNKKKKKVLSDAWIGDALQVYDFLFRFKNLLGNNDEFTISEWLECIRRTHETYLLNYVLSLLVAVVMDGDELKSKDKDELWPGYRCSLLTWPTLLREFLHIRKKTMMLEDRSKPVAFNDVIEAIESGHCIPVDMVAHGPSPTPTALSTKLFTALSATRKVELLLMLTQYIMAETKRFKSELSRLIEQVDRARGDYIAQRNEESKCVRDQTKNDDRIMRGLHRAIPVHWTDFETLCRCQRHEESMDEAWMHAFYERLFHSMSLGEQQTKSSKKEIARYKENLSVLLRLANELTDAGEIGETPLPPGLSKGDRKSRALKEEWRAQVHGNLEKIFAKYMRDVVLAPATQKAVTTRASILTASIPYYNATSALSLGCDRYNHRYWVLADDFSKILVEDVASHRWGYFDRNEQIEQMVRFLNEQGRKEAALTLNLREKGNLYRLDATTDTRWNLTPWTLDHSQSNWIAYPNWRHVLKYEMPNTLFWKNVENKQDEDADEEDGVPLPFQMSVIKQFLLDLQSALHVAASREPLRAREMFRERVRNESTSLARLADYVWRLFKSIAGSWKKKWLNAQLLKQKLTNSEDEPLTYSTVMMCLYVMDNTFLYEESAHCKQLKKNTSKRREKLREQVAALQEAYRSNADFTLSKSVLFGAVHGIESSTGVAGRKRGRPAAAASKTGKHGGTSGSVTPKRKKSHSIESSSVRTKTPTRNTPRKLSSVKRAQERSSDDEDTQSDSEHSKLGKHDDNNDDGEDTPSNSLSPSDSETASAAASDDDEPVMKKLKKSATTTTTTRRTRSRAKKNGEQPPFISKARQNKRYTGARARLTLICVKCVSSNDQDEIVKCCSCHSCYHSFCVDSELYDPASASKEFFCHSCIGEQTRHLQTRRSNRLRSKPATYAQMDADDDEDEETESAGNGNDDAGQEQSHKAEIATSSSGESTENEGPPEDGKRKRRVNKRFEESSSSEESDNDDDSKTKSNLSSPNNNEANADPKATMSNNNNSNNNAETDLLSRIPKRSTPKIGTFTNLNLPKFNINLGGGAAQSQSLTDTQQTHTITAPSETTPAIAVVPHHSSSASTSTSRTHSKSRRAADHDSMHSSRERSSRYHRDRSSRESRDHRRRERSSRHHRSDRIDRYDERDRARDYKYDRHRDRDRDWDRERYERSRERDRERDRMRQREQDRHRESTRDRKYRHRRDRGSNERRMRRRKDARRAEDSTEENDSDYRPDRV